MPRRSPRCSLTGSSVSTATSPRSVTSWLSTRRGGPVRSSSCGWRRIGRYCAYMLALASSTFRWPVETDGRHRPHRGFPFVQPAAAVVHEIRRMSSTLVDARAARTAVIPRWQGDRCRRSGLRSRSGRRTSTCCQPVAVVTHTHMRNASVIGGGPRPSGRTAGEKKTTRTYRLVLADGRAAGCVARGTALRPVESRCRPATSARQVRLPARTT